MSIEGIALEHFSALPQINLNSTTPSCQCHVVFHYFLSDDSKQNAASTTAHRKKIDFIAQRQKVMTTSLSTIWENTDRCAEQYRCASALYLMSVISQTYY